MSECLTKEIRMPKFNVRGAVNPADMKNLQDSIKEKGIIEPLIVRTIIGTSDVELVCGQRRLRAAIAAGLTSVPVIIKDLGDKEAMEISIIENLQRLDLNPVEEAKGFARMLKEFKYTQEDLSSRIGKSQGYISKRLSILELPDIVQEKLISGRLTPNHARVMLHIKDPKVHKEMLDDIEQQDMSAMELENQLDNYAGEFSLKGANFNISECKDCDHNGDNQKEFIYDDNKDILSGSCTNPECYKNKQNTWLQGMKKAFKKQGYQVAEDSDLRKKIQNYWSSNKITDEFKRRNEVTYKAKCMKCKNLFKVTTREYGGKITIEEKCTNSKCYGKLYGSPGGAKGTAKIKEKQEKVNETSRIETAVEAFYSNGIISEITQKEIDVVILGDVISNDYHINDPEILKLRGRDRYDDVPINKLLQLKISKIDDLLERTAKAKIKDMELPKLKQMADHFKINIKKDFKITREYLKALSKPALVMLSTEIGLEDYLINTKKKSPKALYKGSKEKVIDLFLKSGFNLKGKVPAEISGIKEGKK